MATRSAPNERARNRTAVVADHPALGGILDRCAVLVDGTRHDDDVPLDGVTYVDVLPPFAGG